MNYLKPSFSVNPSDAKAPKDCKHGWVAKGRCVLCGEAVLNVKFTRLEAKTVVRSERRFESSGYYIRSSDGKLWHSSNYPGPPKR